MEETQAFSSDPSSGFSFEDLPSNRFGREFYTGGYFKKGDLESLPDQIEKFIDEQLGGLADPPSDAVIRKLNNTKNFTEDPILSLDDPWIKYDPLIRKRIKIHPYRLFMMNQDDCRALKQLRSGYGKSSIFKPSIFDPGLQDVPPDE